ncbi:MAG: UbiD family decarboxylase [Chloroflexi bacterium]|nr:UbiD family decarboxylase [Chloroflexota bacterium]
MTSHLTSLRDTLAFLEKEGEVLAVGGEVSPIYEISGIVKSLDNGPVLLFENIKGYPGVRDIAGVFSRQQRLAKIFGVDDFKKVKLKWLDAMRHPLPPRIIQEAPCQEVVVTENIDVPATLPILKHTDRDGARVLGGGNPLLMGPHFRGGAEISFKRMSFRGKDWGTLLAAPGTHLGGMLVQQRGQRVPIAINIGTPPAVLVTAAGGGIHTVLPHGCDELAIAGAVQGFPVEVVKAKTVEAYALAQAEWVIEGYVDTTQRVWETEEAEKLGKDGVAPLFPEWPGYLGRAHRTWRFEVTAITHRRDRPIFYSPLTHSMEHDLMHSVLTEACFFELAERLIPGLTVDVHIPPYIGVSTSVVYQVKKRTRADEGFQRNILQSAMSSSIGLRLAIAVDEDVDIYSCDDLMWALVTRVDPATDIIISGGGKRTGLMPIENYDPVGEPLGKPSLLHGGMGIDATVPFEARWAMERTHYPVNKVDLGRWFTPEQIAGARSLQGDYARSLAETGR